MAQIRRANDSVIGKVLEHFAGICEVLIFSAYKVFLTSKMHIESVREGYRELAAKAEKLEESYERLQELDQLKSNFLATISHELRTPLTSIIGYAEMLIEGLAGPLQAEQLEYLETIMDKGERLLSLITSILDMTRVEGGNLRLDVDAFDLQETLASAVSSILPQAAKKGVEVDVQHDPSLGELVLDREKIQQCLVNLLGNSVKFTPKGGRILLWAGAAERVPARAQGRFDGAESYFSIQVRDTGIGIPPGQQERIFDSFYQVDGSATREYGGVGLGLSLVKSYVEAHGGEISFESLEGKGTTFTLILPRIYLSPVRTDPMHRFAS
jgi:signal transduction histidine kinase